MTRAYKGVRLKKNRVYTVQDLMYAYKVTQNTVSNWVVTGLKPSSTERPYVFRGSVVTAFHAERRERKRSQLRLGEFKCIACKMAVFPIRFRVDDKPTATGAAFVTAVCPECSASIWRPCSTADLAVLEGGANPNTSEDFAHEEKRMVPDRTLRHKRDRAMFALAFLGALRADTLISLRFGDIDTERRRIIQDARRSRTKNGKSLNIAWFPIPVEFEDTVITWCKILNGADFEADDALFPDNGILENGLKFAKIRGSLLRTMRSKHAVTQAFKTASVNSAQAYTPHSAKHTIAHERDVRPLTNEQRRAWSRNMGHENEQITETHYAKMSDDRRIDVLEGITDEVASSQTNPLATLTDEELGARVRQLLFSLTPDLQQS